MILEINEAYKKRLSHIKNDSAEEYGYAFFSFMRLHGQVLKPLHRDNLLFTSIYYFYMDFMNENMSVVDELQIHNTSYNITYRFGGIFFMLIAWIDNDFKETPEEMAKLFALEINPYKPK